MSLPPKPVAPPPALRSEGQEKFAANTEGQILYMATVLPDWIKVAAEYAEAQANASAAGFDPSALPDTDLDGTQRLIVRNGTGDAVQVGDLRIDIRGGAEGDSLVRSSSGKYVSQPSAISGEIKALAHNTVPQGWLLCDGAEVSRTTYSRLYSLIGDQYGAGDGTATFNVPDLRGEFLRGWDNGRGIDAGRVLGSSQDFATARDAITFSNLNVNQDGSPPVYNAFPDVVAGDNETRPRNVAVNYIIKT